MKNNQNFLKIIKELQGNINPLNKHIDQERFFNIGSEKSALAKTSEFFLNFLDIGSTNTAQKFEFSIKDLFSKCPKIHRKMRICSHLLKKFIMKNFILCAR